MPAAAVALLVFFIGVSVAVGAAVAYAVGPRRPLVVVLPILAAFGALYVVGHRLGLSVGPQVTLFGFEVSLVWDLVVAVLAAAVTAVIQRSVLRRRATAP